MTNPTRQEIIEAHDALEILYDLVEVLSVTDSETHLARKHCASIRAALPPKPLPTMAEIEWDDDIHYLAEAEHKGYGPVLMLRKSSETGNIELGFKNQRGLQLVYADPEDLTPTGRHYTLTEVQE